MSSTTMDQLHAIPPTFLTHDEFSDILVASQLSPIHLYLLKASRLHHRHRQPDVSLYHISKMSSCLQSPPILSRISKSHITDVLQHAWVTSTLGKDEYGVKHFIAFCDEEHFEDCFRLPAGEFLLCAFAALRAGLSAGTTARGEILAI